MVCVQVKMANYNKNRIQPLGAELSDGSSTMRNDQDGQNMGEQLLEMMYVANFVSRLATVSSTSQLYS